MARTNSTSRTPFTQRKLVTKTNFLHSSTPSAESARNLRGAHSVPELSILLNETLPNTMETLRSHVDYLLRLPLPVGEKNRLLLKYWAMECRLEALRLLLDEAEASGDELGEGGIDLSCFDLSDFSLAHINLQSFEWADAF